MGRIPGWLQVLAFSGVLAGSRVAAGQTVTRAFCGEDGKAHLVYADHSKATIPPQQEQVGCADMTIADDHRTVGWSMQVENCCATYPISAAVIVYRDRKKTVIASEQVIWRWHFVDQGKRLAILSGPVHGEATAATLYETHSGKKLATWAGSGRVPEWAKGWENEFASDVD